MHQPQQPMGRFLDAAGNEIWLPVDQNGNPIMAHAASQPAMRPHQPTAYQQPVNQYQNAPRPRPTQAMNQQPMYSQPSHQPITQSRPQNMTASVGYGYNEPEGPAREDMTVYEERLLASRNTQPQPQVQTQPIVEQTAVKQEPNYGTIIGKALYRNNSVAILFNKKSLSVDVAPKFRFEGNICFDRKLGQVVPVLKDKELKEIYVGKEFMDINQHIDQDDEIVLRLKESNGTATEAKVIPDATMDVDRYRFEISSKVRTNNSAECLYGVLRSLNPAIGKAGVVSLGVVHKQLPESITQDDIEHLRFDNSSFANWIVSVAATIKNKLLQERYPILIRELETRLTNWINETLKYRRPSIDISIDSAVDDWPALMKYLEEKGESLLDLFNISCTDTYRSALCLEVTEIEEDDEDAEGILLPEFKEIELVANLDLDGLYEVGRVKSEITQELYDALSAIHKFLGENEYRRIFLDMYKDIVGVPVNSFHKVVVLTKTQRLEVVYSDDALSPIIHVVKAEML